jgi:hypothetical protein
VLGNWQDAAKAGTLSGLTFPLLLPTREPPLPPHVAALASQRHGASGADTLEQFRRITGSPAVIGAADQNDAAAQALADEPKSTDATSSAGAADSASGLSGATTALQPMSTADREKCRKAFRDKVLFLLIILGWEFFSLSSNRSCF